MTDVILLQQCLCYLKEHGLYFRLSLWILSEERSHKISFHGNNCEGPLEVVRQLYFRERVTSWPLPLAGHAPHKHNVAEGTTGFHVCCHSKQGKPCFAALPFLHLKLEAPQASQAVRELQEIISQSQEAGVRHASHLHRHMLQNVATFPA